MGLSSAEPLPRVTLAGQIFRITPLMIILCRQCNWLNGVSQEVSFISAIPGFQV